MLIQFSFENHLSFKNETILSMEAGERLRKFNNTNTMKVNNLRLLKNVVLFGPNGSGKSNVIHALKVFKGLVIKKAPSINVKLPYIPYLLIDSDPHIPTKFEIEFIIDKTQYKYVIHFNEKEFLYEALEIFKAGKYEYYFLRDLNNFKEIPKNSLDISKTVRSNVLFLFALQDKNDNHAINVMRWFKDYLIICDDIDIEDSVEVLKDKETKKIFLELLKIADFNIKDIDVNRTVEAIPNEELTAMKKFLNEVIMDSDSIKVPTHRVRTDLFTIYNVYNEKQEKISITKLPFELESTGTQKFIKIILEILSAARDGKVLIFDEFDDSFHLTVSQALIKLFNSEYNLNQFILTSHELQHLDCDIRKDQIYLLEKDFDGESHMFSLFDFNNLETVGSSIYENKKSRHDISFFKRYMEGLFGGNPQVDPSALIQAISKRYVEH